MSKLLLLIPILIVIIILCILFFKTSVKETLSQNPIAEKLNLNEPKTEEFNNELQIAFQESIDQMQLPEGSIVMYDSYYGKDKIPEKGFETAGNKYFYTASTIKPFYLAAFIKLLEIESLEYTIPFKFVNDEVEKGKIAAELNDYLTYGRQIDPFIVDHIAPYFVYRSDWTSEEIMEKFLYAPDMQSLEFSFSDVIQSTLGPSSNLTLVLLRNHLALEKYETEEMAVNAIESYLNDFLLANGKTANLRIYLSQKSIDEELYNASYFYEIEYLYEYFWQNSFKIDPLIWDLMKNSMLNVSDDPAKSNRRHELKSLAKEVFKDSGKIPMIYEKSGYIGVDFEAIPGLNRLNNWDTMPAKENQRILFINISTFSRIYLENDEYIQFNYAIAVPVYISLDPAYEEVNDDYLVVKNDILNKLDSNLTPVIEKYKGDIQILED